MKKRDLVTLAMVGISAGLLIGGCQQKGNTQETGRRNTAVREQMSPDMKAFYNSLSPDAQDRFLSLDMRHRKMAMQMGTQGQDPNRAVDIQIKDQMRLEGLSPANEFPIHQGSLNDTQTLPMQAAHGCSSCSASNPAPNSQPIQGALHGCSSCSASKPAPNNQPMQGALHGCSSCSASNPTPNSQPMQGALHGCGGCGAGKGDDSNEQRNKRINPSGFNPRGSGCNANPEDSYQKPVIVNQNALSSCGATPGPNGQMGPGTSMNGQNGMSAPMPGMNGKAMGPEMQDFYSYLNPQAQRKFQDLDAKHKTLAVQMTQQSCTGRNACMGLGGCKSDTHECAGLNSCKGQGGGPAIKDPDKAVDAQYRHQMMQRGVMTQEMKNNHGH